jgi:hypothetical protein
MTGKDKTLKIIHPFSPTPTNPPKKILTIPPLLSTPAKKTSKKPHQHPQNGPFSSKVPIYTSTFN